MPAYDWIVILARRFLGSRDGARPLPTIMMSKRAFGERSSRYFSAGRAAVASDRGRRSVSGSSIFVGDALVIRGEECQGFVLPL